MRSDLTALSHAQCDLGSCSTSRRDFNLRLTTFLTTQTTTNTTKMATIGSDTDLTNNDIQYIIGRALSKLNKQRIYQSNIVAEGQDNEDLSASRKIQDAQKALEAVEALRKVISSTINAI